MRVCVSKLVPYWPLPQVTCVYFIYQGTKLLYVGSTVSLRDRMGSLGFARNPDLQDDGFVLWIPCAYNQLESTEQWGIDTFNPPLNRAKKVTTRKPHSAK